VNAGERAAGRVAPARACAFAVVRRTFENGAYTDRALHGEAARAGLDARDRALATQLAFGTVQRRGTLDHLIATLARRPAQALDPPVLAALRLGLFQLCFLDGVADHAAVHESVELAKAHGGRGGHGLVNAVMRRATREAPGLLAGLSDRDPAAAAIRHSHPEWIARLWWEALGPAEARALMAADNEPAEAAVRANTLAVEPAALAAALPVRSAPAPGIPEGLVVHGAFDAHGSPLWRRGELMPQSRASMLVARTLAPEPGERVLDLCAAPGAKTTHLAALMEARGELVAVERDERRAAGLRETCARMHAANVTVQVGDARSDHGAGYDRVLVDPPCSGLGTLRSRPDLRWRASAQGVAELAVLQGEILAAAARAVRPGGTLVYSTCTISPAENEAIVAGLLGADPAWSADDIQSDAAVWKHPSVTRHLLLLPHRDGTDGFFIARLRRAP